MIAPILRTLSPITRRAFRVAFDSRAILRLKGRRHVVGCGDSHVEVFAHIRRHDLAPGHLFDVVKVNGATALGMINPNSRTNALRIFRARIEAMKPWQEVFFQLGEVDCGFVIWYHAERNAVPLDDQFRRSLASYRNIVEWTIGRDIAQVTILSAPPPTILDGQTWGEIANARRSVMATLAERTALTLKYNEALQEMARDLGLRYLDITSSLICLESGVVDRRYMNRDPLDHHLDLDSYAHVIRVALDRQERVS